MRLTTILHKGRLGAYSEPHKDGTVTAIFLTGDKLGRVPLAECEPTDRVLVLDGLTLREESIHEAGVRLGVILSTNVFEAARERAKHFLQECNYESVEKRDEALALISRIWLDGYSSALRAAEKLDSLLGPSSPTAAILPVPSSSSSSIAAAIMNSAVAPRAELPRICRICFCTEGNACVVVDVATATQAPCGWVEHDLCDGCRPGPGLVKLRGPQQKGKAFAARS